MKTTGTMPTRARKRFPLAPVVFALGVAITTVGLGLAWDRGAEREVSAPAAQVTIGTQSHDPQAVLRSHMADALRYRTALTRAEAKGASPAGARVLRDAARAAVIARVERYFPVLTTVDVERMRFGKG